MRDRSRWALPLLLAAAGSAHALLQVLGNLDRQLPFSVYLFGDSELYLAYAASLGTGRLFDLGLPIHPPLAAWLLRPLLTLTGEADGWLPLKALLSLQAGALAALTAVLAGRLGGRLAGMTAGAVGALSFGLAVLATVPGNEAPYLLLTLPVWILLGAGPPRNIWIGGTLGALTGLACLARAEHLLLAPVVLLYLGWDRLRLRPARPGPLLIGLIGLALVLAPWTLRNHRRIRQFDSGLTRGAVATVEPLPTLVPVTIYGPLNFALANLPPAEGEFTRAALPMRGMDAGLSPEDPRHRELLLHGYRIGARALLDDPGRALKLGGRKLAIFSEAFALGWTAGSFPTGLAGVRRPIDLFAPWRPWLRWPLLALGVWGWWLLRRRAPRAAWLLLTVVSHRLLVTLAFFGYVRHGMLLWPLVVTLAVVPLRALEGLPRARRYGPVLVAILVVLGLAYDGWTARSYRSFQIRFGTLPGSDRIDQHLRMELEPAWQSEGSAILSEDQSG